MGKKINAVDLFAGAGGLSEGFLKNGFNVVASIENDTDACNTLRTRHAYWQLKNKGQYSTYLDYLKKEMPINELHSYLAYDPVIHIEVSDKTINKVAEEIKKRMKSSGVGKIDLFIGGPPCQTFSVASRKRRREDIANDPRTMLYTHYAELLKRFKPSMFVFENVTGILSAGVSGSGIFDRVREAFLEAGYMTDYRILNARDFGVLQNRKRVVVMGWGRKSHLEYPEFSRNYSGHTVGEAFFDLPEINAGESVDWGGYRSKPADYISKSGIRASNFNILTQHIARPVNPIDSEIYSIAVKMWKNEEKKLKYSELPERLATHRNRNTFSDRFRVVADNLPYSHTIVSHISKDGHYYIHPDEKQNRSISVREAARLQSFPDDYYFEGSRTRAFMQIGNAVPPLMAGRIAEGIRGVL